MHTRNRLLGTLLATALLAAPALAAPQDVKDLSKLAVNARHTNQQEDQQFAVEEMALDPIVADSLDVNELAAVLSTTAAVRAMYVEGTGVLLVSGRAADVKRAHELFDTLSSKAKQWREHMRVKEEQEEKRMRESERAQADKIAKNTISLDFSGGNVEDFIKALSDQTSSMNVVFASSEARELAVPEIHVRSVTATAALAILESLPFKNGNDVVHLEVDRLAGDPDGVAAGPAAPMVYVVRTMRVNAPSVPSAQDTVVFNLSVLQKHDQPALKGLLSAIETGMALNGKSPSFSMKFHEGSGLLFVRGSADDLRMAAQVVATVMGPSQKEAH